MSLRAAFLALAVVVAGATLVFYLFQRQLRGASFAFGVHPDVVAGLEASLADQKHLAELDPGGAHLYRERFDDLQRTVARLNVLEHNREELAGRYEAILLASFAATALLAATVWMARSSRQAGRLERLRTALAELAAGRTDLAMGERRRDLLGRIATMVEETSRVMARDRRRLAALENLSAWQEAARRHAHEMRTPLTGARMEIGRALDLLERGETAKEEVEKAARSALQELDNLGAFTRRFTSFAKLPRPELKARDLGELAAEFVATYHAAWPGLALELAAPAESTAVPVAVDRDMIRQVLVNLCDNSALAVGPGHGKVLLCPMMTSSGPVLEVSDDGPGVAESVQARLFEPYTTTRTVGEGMGLGLAISKKILLDHGGDLELAATGAAGTTFRLSFPRQTEKETV